MADERRGGRPVRQGLARLPREMRPERDLWPGIAGRLEPRTAARRRGGWRRLAATMALTTAGLLAALWLRPGSPHESSARGRQGTARPPAVVAELRHRDGVLHAHQDLLAVAARRRPGLDEAGALALADGLAELQRATAEIGAALAANPGDRRLRLALAAAYRREAGWAARLGRA